MTPPPRPAGLAPSIEDESDWVSYTFFVHLSRLFSKGYDRPLTEADLGGVSNQDRADLLYAKFAILFEKERQLPRNKRSTWRMLWRTVGYYKLFFALFLFCVYAALQFGPVIILTHLVKYFSGIEHLSKTTLWVLVSMLFVFPMVGSICLAHSNSIMAHLGAQIRNILIGVIYRKSLTISPSKKQTISTGRILTMFSDDTNQIRQFLFFFNNSAIAPLQIGASLYLIYQQVQAATFVGLGYQLFTIPIAGVVFGIVAKMRQQKMRFTDKRVKMLNEVLNGIRIIKYYAWENAFVKKVMEHRAGEIAFLVKMGYLFNTVFGFLMMGAPQVQSVLIFWTFTALGHQLNSAVAFTTTALFGLLTAPFIFLPFGLQQYNQSLVSTQRIMDFLCQDDLVEYVKREIADPEVAVLFENVDLSWLENEEEVNAVVEAAAPSAGAAGAGAGADSKAKGYAPVPSKENGKEKEESKAATAAEVEMVASRPSSPGINRSVHTLVNLNIRIKKGQLVGIVGSVGSGKSSFLAAILGEMHLKGGSVSVASKSIAFCDQRAWIVNANVRDNVLFGQEFDEARFNRAIQAAAMEDDLKILPDGVKTEIGERGINLSGGQKARVSLARAIYSDSDLYLLDDPLSAVDAHVGEHIFQKCCVEALAGKTRLLVTHHSQFLPRCDYVIILDNNGQVAVQGTFNEIMTSGVDISQYVAKKEEPKKRTRSRSGTSPRGNDTSPRERKTSSASATDAPGGAAAGAGAGAVVATEQANVVEPDDEEEDFEEDEESPGAGVDEKGEPIKKEKKVVEKEAKALMTVEERTEGGVPMIMYWKFILAGGWYWMVASALFQVFSQVLNIEANFWLSDWGKKVIEDNYVKHVDMSRSANVYWMNGYAGLNIAAMGCMGLSTVILTAHRTRASIYLHDTLLNKVLFFPVAFFDVTPIGRVINRFSQDVATVDEDLAQSISSMMRALGTVLGALGGIVGSSKGTFLILFVPLCIFYYKFQQFFGRGNTHIARIEAVSRSPIYADFSQTLSGTNTIRAYGQQQRFIRHLEGLANANTVPGVLQQVASQWLAIRMDLVGSLIMLFMGALTAGLQNKNFIPAGYLGLGLSYSIQLTSLMKMAVRMVSTAQAQFNAVERVFHYTDNIPLEEPAESAPSGDNVPPNWPSEGAVEFRDVDMGYRDGPLVLKDVSFKVAPKAKIGIAGRTGCGKSSLMVALFRIERVRSGAILIDGVDIATIPLPKLRGKLCIIPQDPVMFSATVRFNIDPFDEFSDAEVWSVLADVHMTEHVSSLPLKLAEPVAEGGDNFSAGQRQLVCIARAILRRPKVLVMDEATASIDQATDSLIQEMIRTKFVDCTVLTIAHRLDTILDSNKILVMDKGYVGEYDAPTTLLAKEKGLFRELWDRHNKGHGRGQKQ